MPQIKKLVITFFIIALLALIYSTRLTYVPDDMNYSNYCRKAKEYGQECVNDVYAFHCPPVKSIFFDSSLYRQCEAIERHTKLPLRYDFPSTINVKCAPTNLILLSKVERRNRSPDTKRHLVPNIVHYVIVRCGGAFHYLNYMSILSVHKFIKPDYIILHGDCIPVGYWWQRTVQEVANLYSAYMKKPRLVQGVAPRWIEHATDVARLKILYEIGGIYLDTDILVIKSLDNLREYPATLGKEGHMMLNNGIILARPKSAFICMWMNSYRQYKALDGDWNTFSVKYPYLLSTIYEGDIHVETRRLVKPSMFGKGLFDGNFNWRSHYTVHVWKRSEKTRIPRDEKDLMKNFNDCGLGDIMKHIINAPYT